MNDNELNSAWNAAPLTTRAMTIIETDILIHIFGGDATPENCDKAHKTAVRCAERIREELRNTITHKPL